MFWRQFPFKLRADDVVPDKIWRRVYLLGLNELIIFVDGKRPITDPVVINQARHWTAKHVEGDDTRNLGEWKKRDQEAISAFRNRTQIPIPNYLAHKIIILQPTRPDRVGLGHNLTSQGVLYQRQKLTSKLSDLIARTSRLGRFGTGSYSSG